MIIGFSKKSSSFFTNLFCKNFKHCIVILPKNRYEYTLLQIGTDGIRSLDIHKSDIEKLEKIGWEFIKIYHPKTNVKTGIMLLTCVGFAKKALGIYQPLIWRPDGLYKYLKKRPL